VSPFQHHRDIHLFLGALENKLELGVLAGIDALILWLDLFDVTIMFA
jgi:hypothetical protein